MIRLFFLSLLITMLTFPLSSYSHKLGYQQEILLPNQLDINPNFISTDKTEFAHQWDEFEKANGNWTVMIDNATKTPHRAFGKPIKIDGYSNINQENVKDATLSFLRKYAATFNLNVDDLFFVRATKVNKKWYVSFRQKYQEKEVLNSEVELRIFENAKVMAFGVSYYNGIDIEPTPTIDFQQAAKNSIGNLNGKTKDMVALLSTETSGEMFILPIKYKDKVDYRLVYDIAFRTTDDRNNYISYVDAHSGDVLYRQNVTMNMQKVVSTGKVKLNNAHEESTDVFFPYQYINIGGEKYTTDENGEINVEITQNTPISAKLNGDYCVAYFSDQDNAKFQDTLIPGEDYTIEWDDMICHPFERSVYYNANRVHRWFKDIDPNMTSMDFPVAVELIWSFPYGTNASCNQTGDTLSFWNVGDDSHNFSETPGILFHEYGHAVNFRFYMDQGVPRGMQNMTTHEALADVTACFILNDHRLGYGSDNSNPELYMRNLKNGMVYPDNMENESHHDGQILGGAFWDLRELTSLEYASHISHFARYGVPDDENVGVAFSEWFIEVLIADDDDGDLTNGTPHFSEILEAFNNHKIGTSLLLSYNYSHEPLADTEIYDQDFRVECEINPPDFPNIKPDEVKVIYSTDRWETEYEIDATEYETNKYFADIPGQMEPQIIEYFIKVKDNYTEDYVELTMLNDYMEYMFLAGYYDYIIEPFENEDSWIIGDDDDTAVNGIWELAVPRAISIGGMINLQPGEDHTEGGTKCMVTDPQVGYNFTQHMLGLGYTSFIYKPVDISFIEKPLLIFYRWFTGFAFTQPNFTEDPYFEVFYRLEENGEWVSLDKNADGKDDWIKFVIPIPEEAHGAEYFQLKFLVNNTAQNYGAFFEALVDDMTIKTANEVSTSVDDENSYMLSITPNPFSESANISCYLESPQRVSINIHDLLGNMVISKSIENASGYFSYEWNGNDEYGNNLSTGMYILKITIGNKTTTKKIIKR